MKAESNVKLRERTTKNLFWSFAGSTITKIGAFIFSLILARFLMPEGYGMYSIVFSTAMIFFIFTDLGVNTALLRYISSALKEDKRKIAGYYKYLFKLKFSLSFLVAFLLFLLSYPLAFFIFKNPSLFLPFLVASLFVFISTFDTFFNQIFYSTENIKYSSFKESLNQILKILLALLIFYFVAEKYVLSGIFLIMVLISFFLVLFDLFYIRRILPELYAKVKIKIDKKRVRKFMGPMALVSLSGMFFGYVDAIMLGILLPVEYVGYYKVAFSLVFGITALFAFPNIVFLPLFIKLRNKKISRIIHLMVKYISFITIPGIFGIIVLRKYIVTTIFGHEYIFSSLPLYFLAFLIFPAVLMGLFSSLLVAKEKPEIFARLAIFTGMINIILNIVLIELLLKVSSLWATAGAAIATFLSWFIYLFASIKEIRKEFNISISFKPIIKPLISSLVMFGVLIYSISFIEDMNLIIGFLEILLGVFVYLITIVIVRGITKEDLNLLVRLVKDLRKSK